MNNNYKIVKLKSGETLICKLGKIKDKTIVLERPMVFKSIPLPNNPMLFGAEALIMKNWLEFSIDKNVEIPIDHIAALLKPDVMISGCYDMEKEKEDNPEYKQQLLEKMKQELQDNNSPQGLPEKLNINFNVPNDMIPEVLDALGIDVDLPEEDDIIFEDEEPFLPPKPKKNKKKTKDKKKDSKSADSDWGNNWSDWPADPHDYL